MCFIRSALIDRVTLFVGQDAIAIELPKIFLTYYSKMFQVAFGEDRGAQFAEGSTKQMLLPEEDPQDFMVLLRFLIHHPEAFDQLNAPHWPYPCLLGDDDYCCNCSIDHHSLRAVDVAPPMFRLCAMLERLGFELPESLFEVILKNIPATPGLLVAPTVIDWAMDQSLENGYLQRYATNLLTIILKTDLTTFETYEPVLEKHPKLALALAKGLHKKPIWEQYIWSPEQEAWKCHYSTVGW